MRRRTRSVGVPAGGTSGWPGGQVPEEGAAAPAHADAGVRVRAEHPGISDTTWGAAQKERGSGAQTPPCFLKWDDAQDRRAPPVRPGRRPSCPGGRSPQRKLAVSRPEPPLSEGRPPCKPLLGPAGRALAGLAPEEPGRGSKSQGQNDRLK